MSNIISFTPKPDVPDSKFVRIDDEGREMYCYTLSYKFQSGQWSTEVWAYSMDEAQERVDAMRDSLTLLGQLFGSVPS